MVGDATGGWSSQLPSAGPRALLTTPTWVPFSKPLHHGRIQFAPQVFADAWRAMARNSRARHGH
eukprot:1183504-Prorocentrum_minimum.AAC.2